MKNVGQFFGSRASLCCNANRKRHRIGRSTFAIVQFETAFLIPVTDPCPLRIAKCGLGGLIRYSIDQILVDAIEFVIRTLSDAVEAIVQCALRSRGRTFTGNG